MFFLHIISKTDGTDGFTLNEVNSALSIAEDDYSDDAISFTILGVDTIKSDYYYNFSASKFGDLINTNPHEYAIDIYFVKNVSYGRASDIPGTSLVIGGTYVNTSVLSHELGHCIGLFHTHSGRGCNDFANCEEAIDGSNCETCGDLVCDTPADPCLSGYVDANCNYTGPPEFNPDTENIMSYAPPSCLNILTDGQIERIYSEIVNNELMLKVLVPSISGTLSHNEYWYTPLTLTGNVIVPSGVTLTITSDAEVNLVNGSNRYSIISTGGTINVNEENLVGLRAKLGYHGENGYCSSIQTAINNSHLNNNIHIVPGTHNENISINSKPNVLFVYGDAFIYETIINGNIYIYGTDQVFLNTLSTRFLNINSSDNVTIEKVLIAPWSEEAEGSLFSNNCNNLHLMDVTLNNTPDSYGAYFSNSVGQITNDDGGSHFENNGSATRFIGNASFNLYTTYFCNNPNDIYTDGSSYVYAPNNTFSDDPAVTTYGNVDYPNPY